MLHQRNRVGPHQSVGNSPQLWELWQQCPAQVHTPMIRIFRQAASTQVPPSLPHSPIESLTAHMVYICTCIHGTVLGLEVSLPLKCMRAMSEFCGQNCFKRRHLFRTLSQGTVSCITNMVSLWYVDRTKCGTSNGFIIFKGIFGLMYIQLYMDNG